MFKRLLSILLVCCFCICSIISVFAKDIDELEEKQKELQRKSKEYEAILNDTKGDIEKQEEYNTALSDKLYMLNDEILLSKGRVNDLDIQINEKTEQVAAANEEIKSCMNRLRTRIKNIYMAGDASTLEVILGAKDFTDFLDKIQLIRTVSVYDNNIINDIKDKLKSISAQKKELEDARAELNYEQQMLEGIQLDYEQTLEENKQQLDSLYKKSQSASDVISGSNSSLLDVEAQIEAFYADQKRVEEENRRLREEEEKRRQQEEEKRQQREAAEEERRQQEAEKQAREQEQQATENEFTPDNANDEPSYQEEDDYEPEQPSYTSGYIWPVPGFYYVISSFDEWRGASNHGALDITGSGIMWANVVAAASGTVITAVSGCSHNYGKSYSCGCGGGYGNYIVINHGNGKATVYAHLSSINVSYGSYVSAGDVIGYVGSTGQSTGAHLHYETRLDGVKYDPMSEY